MRSKLRLLASAFSLALSGACDSSFSPDWKVPVEPSPEAGEPGMDAGDPPDAGAGLDAAGDSDGGDEEAGSSPSDASVVTSVMLLLDCSIEYVCSDGGDASCATTCQAPCKAFPCSFGLNICRQEGPCKDFPCTWCRNYTPPPTK
jgi:hypothetical protein